MLFPQVEELKSVSRGFVAKVVDPARKGIYRIEVSAQVFWQQTRTNTEIFVVGSGQMLTRGESGIEVIWRARQPM